MKTIIFLLFYKNIIFSILNIIKMIIYRIVTQHLADKTQTKKYV